VSSEEQHHVALPKLYGAPAYARPPRPVVSQTPRPFDPDDLPLEAFMTPEERAWKEAALNGAPTQGRTSTVSGGNSVTAGEQRGTWASTPALRPRPFRLRSLAARLLRVGDPEAGRSERD
jgi:hypothetical protein